MRAFDIPSVGRCWTAEEIALLHDELPERPEMVKGMRCIDDEQRLLLLGALLEPVGTERAVRLGPLNAWKAAVARRQEDSDSDNMPAVGAEHFGCRPIGVCRSRSDWNSNRLSGSAGGSARCVGPHRSRFPTLPRFRLRRVALCLGPTKHCVDCAIAREPRRQSPPRL